MKANSMEGRGGNENIWEEEDYEEYSEVEQAKESNRYSNEQVEEDIQDLAAE